jgi:uncharacterized protein VirK/YbjX
MSNAMPHMPTRHERRKQASIERNDRRRLSKRFAKLKSWFASHNIFVQDLASLAREK